MSILNYFKKVDGTKLTPKSVNGTPKDENRVLSDKKSSSSSNVLANKNAEREKVKKKLELDNKENNDIYCNEEESNDVEMIDSREKMRNNKSGNKYDSSFINDDDDEEEEVVKPAKSKNLLQSADTPKSVKRKRILLIDSDEDEDDEEKKAADEKEKKKKPKTKPSKEESDYESEEEEEEEEEESDDDGEKKKKPTTTLKNKNLQLTEKSATPKSLKIKGTTTTNSPAGKLLSSFAATPSSADADDAAAPFDGKFKHLTYEFLQDDKIMDINMRKRSDPNYDPRTVYVPPDFKKKLTPALRQWWELKATNFDVLFFFKVGKFYELYHQDAVIAVKELGLTFMKVCDCDDLNHSWFFIID